MKPKKAPRTVITQADGHMPALRPADVLNDLVAHVLAVTACAVTLRERIHLGRGIGTATDAEGDSFGDELTTLCCAVAALNAKLNAKVES